jgi:hypothetical protein
MQITPKCLQGSWTNSQISTLQLFTPLTPVSRFTYLSQLNQQGQKSHIQIMGCKYQFFNSFSYLSKNSEDKVLF